MTFNEALFILRHGSAEGLQKYLQAIKIIEDEVNAVQERNGRLQAEIAEKHKDLIAAEEYAFTLKQQNARLFKIAGAMHTWIYLHTVDEEKAYKECGLTDEEDQMLGYAGKIEFGTKDGEGNDT